MGVVMTALAGSFAIWGINDIFHGYGNSALAKIGKTEIQVEQFRQAYNNRLETISHDLGHPLPPDQANALGLNRQVLSEIVAQAGIDQQASRMGLGVSTAEISRHITSNPQLQNEHGQFDPQRFQLLLQNMQMTEPAFIASERQTMLRRQLIDSVSGNFNPPQAWLDAINQFQNEERSIKYVALGPAQAGDIPQPTDEQLGKYFDDRKIMFRAPEYRKIDTITVTPPALAQWMQISDDDIKKAYDDQHSRFVTPEKRHIEQIVFPTMADAQAAADRIKSGTSFADIATARGLKPQDIDLGTLSKSAMVDPKVADAAFALKEGEVSAPIADPIRRRAGDRAQDRAHGHQVARRRVAGVAQPDRARSRQAAGAGHPRQDRRRPRRRQHARGGRAEGEAAGRHFRRRPLGPRSAG